MYQVYRCKNGGMINANNDKARVCKETCNYKMSHGKCGYLGFILSVDEALEDSKQFVDK